MEEKKLYVHNKRGNKTLYEFFEDVLQNKESYGVKTYLDKNKKILHKESHNRSFYIYYLICKTYYHNLKLETFAKMVRLYLENNKYTHLLFCPESDNIMIYRHTRGIPSPIKLNNIILDYENNFLKEKGDKPYLPITISKILELMGFNEEEIATIYVK